MLPTYRQPGSQPSPARPCRLPRQATGGLGDPGLADTWVTSQLRSGGTLQARRRLALHPRSLLTLTRTWPWRLKGTWPAVPWAFTTLSAHTALGKGQPPPGRPYCLTAVGPKPLGDTIESARPLRASKATLAPTPTAEESSLCLVTGWARGPVPAQEPTPAHDRGETAEGGLFPEGAVERHTGRQVAAARMGAGAVGQVQVEGLAGLPIISRACGRVWVRASHPGSGWGAAASQGRLLAACPAGPAGSAPSGARCVGRGLRR